MLDLKDVVGREVKWQSESNRGSTDEMIDSPPLPLLICLIKHIGPFFLCFAASSL